MMYANKPYQKVDDGVGAGLISGALVGGGLTAGMQFGANSAARGVRGVTGNALRGAIAGGGSTRGYSKMHRGSVKTHAGIKAINKSAFGHGGMRTAGAYIGAAAIGGLIGMAADGLND